VLSEVFSLNWRPASVLPAMRVAVKTCRLSHSRPAFCPTPLSRTLHRSVNHSRLSQLEDCHPEGAVACCRRWPRPLHHKDRGTALSQCPAATAPSVFSCSFVDGCER